MTSPRPYVVFPAEVVSNTHDFEVRWVVHAGRRMRGVFARRAIRQAECSVFIGVYPGYARTRQEIRHKVGRYAERHALERQAAAGKVTADALCHRQYDAEHVLDPTDEEGHLLLEFAPYIAAYVNEPAPALLANPAIVHNRTRQRCEVWLLHAVGEGDEVYLYYGEQYIRDYPISAPACEDRLAYYLPEGSCLDLDRRAPPPVLRLPVEPLEA